MRVMIVVMTIFLITCQSDESSDSLDNYTTFLEKLPNAICSYYQACQVEVEYAECVNEIQENIATLPICSRRLELYEQYQSDFARCVDGTSKPCASTDDLDLFCPLIDLLGESCEESGENDDDFEDDDSQTTSNQSTQNIEDLSFFEEELVGKWHRYHGYDGTDEYWVFKADRTGCYWEEASGSSRRNAEKVYSHWELDDARSTQENVFPITVRFASSGNLYASEDEFHYVKDEIRKGGYDNLIFRPSTTDKDCE